MANCISDTKVLLRPCYCSKKLQTQSSRYAEKRQVFLHSYQFRRKQTLGQRITKCFLKLRHSLWFGIRSAKRVQRFVWAGLHFALRNKRRRLSKFMDYYFNNNNSCNHIKEFKYELFYSSPAPSCLIW